MSKHEFQKKMDQGFYDPEPREMEPNPLIERIERARQLANKLELEISVMKETIELELARLNAQLQEDVKLINESVSEIVDVLDPSITLDMTKE